MGVAEKKRRNLGKLLAAKAVSSALANLTAGPIPFIKSFLLTVVKQTVSRAYRDDAFLHLHTTASVNWPYFYVNRNLLRLSK